MLLRRRTPASRPCRKTSSTWSAARLDSHVQPQRPGRPQRDAELDGLLAPLQLADDPAVDADRERQLILGDARARLRSRIAVPRAAAEWVTCMWRA